MTKKNNQWVTKSYEKTKAKKYLEDDKLNLMDLKVKVNEKT